MLPPKAASGEQAEGGVQALPLQPPPPAPRPSELFGATHAAPSLAGGVFTSLGKEDPAKINRYQAVSPGNKPASHWLRVMSPPG